MSNKDIVFWTVIAFACMGMYCVIMTTLCFVWLVMTRRDVNAWGKIHLLK
jgi:hypothetical protein